MTDENCRNCQIQDILAFDNVCNAHKHILLLNVLLNFSFLNPRHQLVNACTIPECVTGRLQR